MARIKSQGTKVYALIAGAIVRFTYYNAIDLGSDSTSKIDTTCPVSYTHLRAHETTE